MKILKNVNATREELQFATSNAVNIAREACGLTPNDPINDAVAKIASTILSRAFEYDDVMAGLLEDLE